MFNKKNEAQLQILENELANTTQCKISIVDYFLNIKRICRLNSKEVISKAQLRRIVIRDLTPEYIPFGMLIQEWVHQPSMDEFEKL